MNAIVSRPLLLTALVAALSGAGLSACAPLVVGGAVGGAMVASDRRTSGTVVEDQAIELKAASRLREVLGDKGHVNLTSYGRLLLITGEVPTEADKAAVGDALGRVENVRGTLNELGVGAPSSFSTRSNDALITSKVKATYVDAKDIFANAYKVVTERGVVYLMGRVTEREAKRGADLARAIPGVRKVVTAFDIVTEAELNGRTPPAPSTASSTAS